MDEFENPDENAPVGAHRRPTSRWRPVLPFLLILVLAPLLAWGVVGFMQRSDSGTSGASVVQSGTQTPQSSDNAQSSEIPQSSEAPQSSAVPSAEPTETPTPTPTQAPAEVDRSISVQVLNISGIQGYAAQMAGYLSNDGFTSVTAGNSSDWLTQENTVFYSSEDQKATAERIAELTGIGSVRLDTEATGGTGIIVLLVD